jgi:quercetin dioxygenase-like cupin family protein
MIASTKWIGLAVAIGCAAAATAQDQPAHTAATHGGANAHIVSSHALPQLDGSHVKVTVVEVAYGPGGSSAPHSHPCPVIGYVLDGALRMQVKGETEAVYKAGESFYEAPNGVHLISANASDKAPARFVVTFVCDHETPLTVPSPQDVKR